MTPVRTAGQRPGKRRYRAFMAQPFKHPQTGTYYIRRKVPADLQPILGREYKRSLKTKDPGEAKRAFAQAFEQSEHAFAMARAQARGAQVLTRRDVQVLAGRWFDGALAAAEATGDFSPWLAPDSRVAWEQGDVRVEQEPLTTLAAVIDDLEPEYVSTLVDSYVQQSLRAANIPTPPEGSPLRESLLAAFREHWLRLSDVAMRRRGGDWHTRPKTIGADRLSIEGIQVASGATRGVLEAFEGYAQERYLNDGKGRAVERSVSAYRAVIREFIELVGDLPLSSVNREVVARYRAMLARLPRPGRGIRSLPAPEKIARADKDDLPRIDAATVRNKLHALSAVLSYAVRMQFLGENPVIEGGVGRAAARAVTKRALGGRSRNHYTEEELKAIFQSPVFAEPGWRWPSAEYGKAWHWVPLLMYYTGARREEIAQLLVSDVAFDHPEGPFLSILTAEGDGDNGRGVKTPGSRRWIPLHADLLKLGLRSYVGSLDQAGQLFPYLKANPAGYFGANFGKRWAQYLRDVVELQSPARPSHGFRHTFKTRCRAAGIPEEVADAITGHVGHARVARAYGEMPLARMATEIGKYPSAPLLALELHSS